MMQSRWNGAAILVATIMTTQGFAQAVPFKARVVMKDGSDGSTATGVIYFSGAKMRTELEKDGDNVILLIDPATQSHTLLMPSEKMYMPLPMGQGPINVSISGPADPTNPCSSGGNTECMQGPAETVNGYATIRWDYTAPTGVRTRAWFSTKLRFPIKTQDDDGSSTEFTNIAEGPQPASLFSVPADYASMDLGAIGGRGRGEAGAGRGAAGAGRGRGNPMGGIMGNLPPEAAAAMEAAMRAEPVKGSAPKGSDWEKGKGWILTVTVVGTRATKSTTKGDPRKGTLYNTLDVESTFQVKMVGSAPLNHVSPSPGIVGGPGPVWMLMSGAPGIGLPEAEKVPVSFSVTSESVENRRWTSDCVRVLGQRADPGKATVTMKGSSQINVPTPAISAELGAQILFSLSADLKSYDLVMSFSPRGGTKEVTETHTELTGCDDKKVRVEDTSETSEVEYRINQTELKGLPLPASASTVTGSKKMQINVLGRTEPLDATVTWTLTQIR